MSAWLAIVGASAGAALGQPRLTDLGIPAGFWSAVPYDMNEGENVVVGITEGNAGRRQAFQWREGAGIRVLGVFPGGIGSAASAVSADGEVVVGTCFFDNENGRAFRWTQQGGMRDLGALPGGLYSTAADVSADGRTVVGWSHVAGDGGFPHAFRWTLEDGMVDLGLPAGMAQVRPARCSADGSLILGWMGNESLSFVPCRWTADAGFVALPMNPPFWGGSALSANRDASIIVGSLTSDWSHPMRWDHGEPTDLGLPPGAIYGSANAVTSRGRVESGSVHVPGVGSRACLWTPRDGAVLLSVFLRSAGLDVGSMQLASVGINPRGTAALVTQYVAGVPHALLLRGLRLDCPADENGDGVVDFSDVVSFIDCFEGGACSAGSSADFNGDGFADFFDYDGFVAAFELGC